MKGLEDEKEKKEEDDGVSTVGGAASLSDLTFIIFSLDRDSVVCQKVGVGFRGDGWVGRGQA